MKIVGIIAEYNPLHEGHKYQLNYAKSVLKADFIVVLMSGDFVQRGAPAIYPKYYRTKCALENGADLVLELPVCYSTGSAEAFAYGAVSILNSLGCIDELLFGMENPELIDNAKELASILVNEPDSFKKDLKDLLKLGISYPEARKKALESFCTTNALELLDKPNNILTIEYLKALIRLKSAISPTALKRDFSYKSASEIRASLLNKADNSIIYSICENDFSQLLLQRLHQVNSFENGLFSSYEDVDITIENKLKNYLQNVSYADFTDVINAIKSKQYTYTRISRALLHIMLNQKKDSSGSEGQLYSRVLGFRQSSKDVLALIIKYSSITIINGGREIEKVKDNPLYIQNYYSEQIYQSVFCKLDENKNPTPYGAGHVMLIMN